MTLTSDQQATLQLLLERGQSYSDLAQLLGVDEDEVRERARGALAELGGADPDRNVGLTDYLLGEADPIGRADASRHLREDPDRPRARGELISERLRAISPRRRAAEAAGRAAPRAPRAGRRASDGRGP